MIQICSFYWLLHARKYNHYFSGYGLSELGSLSLGREIYIDNNTDDSAISIILKFKQRLAVVIL